MALNPMNILYSIRKSIEGNMLGLDSTGAASPLGDHAPYLMGRDLRGWRFFPLGKTGQLGCDYKVAGPILHNDVFDDFLGANVQNFWNALHGSDATAANAIFVADNGIDRLTSGAGSTHTMAVNGAQTTAPANMKISDGAAKFETRLGNISALTGQSIAFGKISTTTLNAPFTIAGGTVTANVTNGVAFVQDSAGTNTHLNCVAVNAGGTPQVVTLTNDVGGAAVFNTYRIETDALGNANFFIDGVLVAQILLAVATTSLLGPSVGMFSNVTTGSQTLDIDYILTQSLRT